MPTASPAPPASTAVPPGLTFESRIVVTGEPGQIDGAGDFLGDQRPAHEAPTLTFEAVGDEPRSGDVPVRETLQVLPFQLHAWLGEPASERFLAEAVIALDVVVAAADLDAHGARRRVHGDDFSLEGEYRIEVRETRRCLRREAGQELPPAHAQSSAANLRR